MKNKFTFTMEKLNEVLERPIYTEQFQEVFSFVEAVTGKHDDHWDSDYRGSFAYRDANYGSYSREPERSFEHPCYSETVRFD